MRPGTLTTTSSPGRSVADLVTDRGAELRAEHGQPDVLTKAEVGQVLRRQGLRDTVHPYDCIGFRYPTAGAARAYAEVNRAEHQHVVHGPYETTGGIVAVLDLRPSLHSFNADWESTDPALPDDWTPEVNRG